MEANLIVQRPHQNLNTKLVELHNKYGRIRSLPRLALTSECTGRDPPVDGYTGTGAVAVATPSVS